MLPNSDPFVYVGIKIRTPETLLLQCMQVHITQLECYLKQTTMTCLDPKSKCHVTCQGSERWPFTLFAGELSPVLPILRARAFPIAHLLESEWAGEGVSPILLEHSTNTSAAEELGTPPLWDSFFIHRWHGEGAGHEVTVQCKRELYWVSIFKHFPFGVADKQADVGGFISISRNGQVELGILRDFWYFLLPVRLNVLQGDLHLNILTLPLLIVVWKTKQRGYWKWKLKKKRKRCWSIFFPSLEREHGH